MKKSRCPKCNRILTKLYKRDASDKPYYKSSYIECRDCKEIIKDE